MMFRFLLSIFILVNFAITPSFAYDGISNPQSIQTGSSYQEVSNNVINSQNYLSSAIMPNNTITKWQKMPISVCIPNNKYSNVIESAFQEWQIASDKIVTFKKVNSVENADIIVYFVDNFKNSISKNGFQGGLSKPCYSNDSFIKSEILLLKTNPISKKAFPDKQMYVIALHEIGHSIGIIGHSPNKEDLMYYKPSSSTHGLSAQDINTIKLLYSPDSKNFKVAPYEIQQIITEAEAYIKEFPNNPYSWLKLADLYRANEQYNEAINAYNKALKLDQDCSQAYYAIALCYNRMNNIKVAFKYFLIALQKEPENTKFINAYVKICIETNQKEKAEKYLSNYLKNHPDAKNDSIIQDAIKMFKK